MKSKELPDELQVLLVFTGVVAIVLAVSITAIIVGLVMILQ